MAKKSKQKKEKYESPGIYKDAKAKGSCPSDYCPEIYCTPKSPFCKQKYSGPMTGKKARTKATIKPKPHDCPNLFCGYCSSSYCKKDYSPPGSGVGIMGLIDEGAVKGKAKKPTKSKSTTKGCGEYCKKNYCPPTVHYCTGGFHKEKK